MKKRIVSTLLALALCLTLLPAAALADGEATGSTPTLGKKLTLGAVASYPNGYDGETYFKLVDGRTTAENGTKWCFTFPSGGAYVILKAESAVTISGYSFTTGDNNATEHGRNPKSWTLYGSNKVSDWADSDWTEIAAVTNDKTMQNQNFAKFDFVLTTAPSAYQYYKFQFSENQGANVMQLSEIALYELDCEHDWKNVDAAVPVTCTTDGYQLQRCGKCGSTKKVDIVRAKGHDYKDGKCTKCYHVCCASLTTADKDVYYFENIKDALDKAQGYDGCIVKLYSTATYDKQYECGGTFTIDLNGQQAAFRLMISYGSNITLINTAEEQATFGGDSIDDPVVYAHDGTVTVGRSDGSDGDIRFRSKDNTGSSNETFKIYKYSKPSLYGGSYMGITCDESAKLYNYLPAGFAFADSTGKEVDATGNTLSEVHIVPHTAHQKDGNGFCTICGACDHPADKVDTGTFQCSLCGKTMLARVALGEDVAYFTDLNEAIRKTAETDGCTLKLLANAGALTVSKGAFTLDLNSKTVNSLTVSGGSVKLTNVKKIGTLTVSGDVTLASLLPEGYTFYKSLYWYNEDELAKTTSLSDVSVRQIPLKDLTVKANKESYTYGDDITLTASVTKVGDSVVIQDYYWREDEIFFITALGDPLVIEKPTAGEHTYTCDLKTNDWYSLSRSITVNVTPKSITGAEVTLEQGSFEYDGTAKTPTVSEVKLGETTLTSADYDVTVTPQTSVGSDYTVTVTGKGNYTGTASASWSITTKTVENPTIELSGGPFTYDNGNAITPTVTVKDSETIISADEYTVAYTNNINVGTATVTVADKDGGNYTVSGSTTFTINKANGSAAAVTANVLTYNGEEQTLITVTGTAAGGTMQYKLDNGEYGTALPKATNAGTYTVWYKVEGDENHEDVAEKSVSVTIAKKQITVPTADTTEFTYNGEAQTYQLTPNDDYTISDNVTQTNANKEGYTITVSLKDKANTVWADAENDTVDKTYQFIIHKAKATVTATDKTAYVGDKAPDLSKPEKDKDYTITGLIGVDTLTGEVALAYDGTLDMTKTGEAAIKISGTLANDNYDVAYADGKLTITARPSSGGGSSTTKTETTTNPDGSTTKTETKSDSTVVETTTNTDGSTTTTEAKTETKADGSTVETKKETSTAADGSKTESKTETTTAPDGSKTETKSETKMAADGTKTETEAKTETKVDGTTTSTETSKTTDVNGSTGTTTTTNENGNTKTEAEAKISEKAVEAAKKNDTPVTAPVEVKAGESSNSAPTVKIELPENAGETKVEIPVSDVNSGTVAVIVNEDGTEEIVKNSTVTEDGVVIVIDGNATVKIIDNSKDFIDTRDHWSRDEVNFVASRELFNGIGNNLFGVSGDMTRGMVNTVLARLAGEDTNGGVNWYDKGTKWAKKNGITDGTNPTANVTREQLAAMLYRFAGSPEVSGELSFTDADRVSDYAKDALLWAVQNGILNGIGNNLVAPTAGAERAQVAAMMARYLKNVG